MSDHTREVETKPEDMTIQNLRKVVKVTNHVIDSGKLERDLRAIGITDPARLDLYMSNALQAMYEAQEEIDKRTKHRYDAINNAPGGG